MVEKESIALLGQVEMAKANTVKEFKASQPLIDSCVVFYDDGFENCLKQVKFVYLYLDLSKVTMDDPLPSTPVGDTIFEETDDSTKSKPNPKDDSVILAQPAADPPVTPLVPSTEPLNVESPLAQDVQDLLPKGDENPQDASTSLTWLFIFNDYSIVYLVQFPENVKCPFVFWALFVKTLLYVWYTFYICHFLACVDLYVLIYGCPLFVSICERT